MVSAPTYETTRDAFLGICREDLAYTARWGQVQRRVEEQRFLREQASH